MSQPSSTQLISLMACVEERFTRFPMNERARLPYLDTFRDLLLRGVSTNVVRHAIGYLNLKSDHRPTPNEIATAVRARLLPSVRDTRNHDPWPDPPSDIHDRITALKALIPGGKR